MSHKMLRPFIVKVSVLGYFPLLINNNTIIEYLKYQKQFENVFNEYSLTIIIRGGLIYQGQLTLPSQKIGQLLGAQHCDTNL